MNIDSEARPASCDASIADLTLRKCASIAAILATVVFLNACGGGGSSGNNRPASPPATNQPPSISGTPATSVVVSTSYRFTPTASDPEGDPLSFSITGLPPWAEFDSDTGELSGEPAAVDVGNFPDITISVTAAQQTTALPAFDIAVVQIATGALTVSWTAPTENADGSTLLDLAGYRIRWGTQPGTYPNRVEINDSGATRFVIENLVPAEYYLVITALDEADNESEFSAEAFGVVE